MGLKIEILKTDTKEDIQRKMEQMKREFKPYHPFDAKKFFGTVKFEEEGLTIQKRLRNEWN